jgi:hypothetical protein
VMHRHEGATQLALDVARPRGVAMQFDRMELCGLCGTPPLSYVDPEAGTAVADDMIGTE